MNDIKGKYYIFAMFSVVNVEKETSLNKLEVHKAFYYNESEKNCIN